jgi:predicted AAA+ superfamily ATPase
MDFWKELVEHGRKVASLRDKAFELFSGRGGYPIAHARAEVPWPDVAAQLNETVIKRVIEHDLRAGERGRKRDPQLLEMLFKLCCRYAGQSPNPTTLAREAQRALSANIGPQRVRQYLHFLNDTLLVRLVLPLEIRIRRTKGAPKICLADHGLRASWLQEVIPLAPQQLDELPHLADLAGHLAESGVGAYLLTLSGLELAHLPERGEDPEVDFVLTLGERRIPLEVKYRRTVDPLRDTEGLRAFLETKVYHAPFGVMVTPRDDVVVNDPRIIAIPLSSLLLLC